MEKEHLTNFMSSEHMIFLPGITINYYYILKVFGGNLKSVCQKAIKANSSSAHNKSIFPMFRYHFIKMNKV